MEGHSTTMSTPNLYILDLDAARREAQIPDGITLTLRGETFTLPSELPLDVFDPLLAEEFDLTDLIRKVMDSPSDSYSDALIDVLVARPDLPKQTVAAVRSVLERLFNAAGDDHFTRFVATRPSVPDYTRLTAGLVKAYGVGLGEAFKSLSTAVDGGATSRETSKSTQASTPETSGVGTAQDPRSSESGD